MKRVLEILIILLTIMLFVLIMLTVPKIDVGKDIVIDYYSKYNNKFIAKSIFKDYTNEVKVTTNLDTNKIGKYQVNYELQFGFFKIKNKKEVTVVDKKKPVIELLGDTNAIVCPNCKYQEEGFKVLDEYDGDLTDKVTTIEEDNKIIYKVKDSSNNETIVERSIVYQDVEKPLITLEGKDKIYLYVGSKYNEPGYKAYDNCDGDITAKVSVTNNVDTSKVGNYEVIYEVVDSSNNSFSIKRAISVLKRPTYNSGSGNGKIYLTFDDGPSSLTSSILDILESEGVNATFFVTSNVNNYPNVLRRAYNNGNAIALHTYSHDYSYIYSSSGNYFSDLERINNAVTNIIGKGSNVIRFPGGSSNTISRAYSVGIMGRLSQEVVARGYNYFDWNIDSNDAGGAVKNSNMIYNNVVNNLSYNKTNVVLMHDSYGHEATVNALRDIIRYGKNNGYSFGVLTSNMQPVRHGVNN